jgi:MFS family permease
MTIYGLNMDGLGMDSRPAKIRRAAFGALYGLLGGAAFVMMATFIDIWLHPDLPLGVNWDAVWLRLPLIGLGLAFVGAVTCWWHEAWQGLVSGAFMTSALALITALFSSQVGAGMKFIVLVFILLPVAAMTLPIAFFLRWLTERHARALHLPWRAARIGGLVALMISAGVGLGYFMKASSRGVEATRFVHAYLQDLTTSKNPLVEVAGVPERDDQPYTLYSTTSFDSTEGFDIHIRYADGYRLRCAVILYPGRTPYLKSCTGE